MEVNVKDTLASRTEMELLSTKHDFT